MTLKQQYDSYTTEDHGTWNILYNRQFDLLKETAYPVFLKCLAQLRPDMSEKQVADLDTLTSRLKAQTGWGVEVVKGLIPVEEFFALLADKRFCSSTWMRKRSQLDYLEEPDMFHDTFGHLPMILDPDYAAFMHEFGRLGSEHSNNAVVMTALQRLYWFTIEFGLIKGENGPQIFGAGILSSYGEVDHVYAENVERLPFDLQMVINNPFVNSEIQNRYYVLDSMSQLNDALPRLRGLIDRGLDITPAIVR